MKKWAIFSFITLFIFYIIYLFVFEEVTEDEYINKHLLQYQVEHGQRNQESEEECGQRLEPALEERQEDGQGM